MWSRSNRYSYPTRSFGPLRGVVGPLRAFTDVKKGLSEVILGRSSESSTSLRTAPGSSAQQP
ncbi:MAG: hypothetical protein RL689_243, partial [Planctomycetota bacterium]